MKNVTFKRIDRKSLQEMKREGITGFDMHFHTRYSSDGIAKIQNVLKRAHKLGIGIAITDHNKIQGATACQKNKYNVPIIPGIEATTQEGTHLLLYFHNHCELREFYTKELMPGLKKNPFRTAHTLAELLELSRQYNCATSIAHPYAPGKVGIRKLELTDDMTKNVDFIEAINGYCLRSMNKKSIQLAKELDKPCTAGSDGHTTPELGRTLNCVTTSDPSEALEMMLKKKNAIIGKEYAILKRAILTIDKQSLLIHRQNQKNLTGKLLRHQFGDEFKHIKEKFAKGKEKKIDNFLERHSGKVIKNDVRKA